MFGLVGEAAAFVQGKADDSLGSGRIAIWKETLQLIQDRPILGEALILLANAWTCISPVR